MLTYVLQEIRTVQALRILHNLGRLRACGKEFADGEFSDLGPFLLVICSAGPVVVVLEELVLNEAFLFCRPWV